MEKLIAPLVEQCGMLAPVLILLAGWVLICLVWIVGLSWHLVSTSDWVWWWFRLSKRERQAWRRISRR